jgi:glycosyltransferase involved in cell wall biosynthesis
LKKIACVSDAIREVVVAGIGCADHCVTIHSCIDYRKFQPYVGNNFLRCEYNISEDTTLIGNTSAIAPHKDYFTFVDSAKDYLENYDQKVMFFIIGKGEQKEAVYEYVTKLGIADHFIFTGFVENIEEVLPSLDIFLITSKTEGLGTSVIDAFASKVPVVATRAGGIPELVENMQTGLLSDIGDYTDLAKNLFRLKKERKLAGQLIENAFARAQDFNVRSMATRYLKIYKEILFNK